MVDDLGNSRYRPVLEVESLAVEFKTREGAVQAVRDISFTVGEGEMVGLVGESGSGKSVTGQSIMRLLPPDVAHLTGSVRFKGVELLELDEREMRRHRGTSISMVFQEPMSALDPVFTVSQQMVEAVRAHEHVSKAEARDRALKLLEEVGIPDPRRRLDAYPSELSGGMQQRIMIAMALLCDPQVLIADEPTTALDVTIQAQVVDLLRRLSEARSMAVILISHDLALVSEVCDRVITMYAGEIIEMGTTDEVLMSPRHPYTAGLLHAIPTAASRHSRLPSIPGHVPSLFEMPAGCRFAPRCEFVEERCLEGTPSLVVSEAGHASRCLRQDELTLVGMVE